MTEEVNAEQGVPQGDTATAVKQDDSAPATGQTTETAPMEPDQDKAKKEEGKWYIDVITGLRHNVRDTKAKLEALEAENAALKAGHKPDQPNMTDAEINRRAAELAAANRFNEQCNNIAEKGKRDFPTFDGALANLRAVGALGDNANPAFLHAVAELPEAHKLLHHLGNNPDEAARINALPPLKMAIELAKIETEISAPKVKPVSKAPAPIIPINASGGNTSDLSSPDISMEEFSRIREKQRMERAKR